MRHIKTKWNTKHKKKPSIENVLNKKLKPFTFMFIYKLRRNVQRRHFVKVGKFSAMGKSSGQTMMYLHYTLSTSHSRSIDKV